MKNVMLDFFELYLISSNIDVREARGKTVEALMRDTLSIAVEYYTANRLRDSISKQ